jgi:HD superfamily phosphohydrolase
VRFRQPDYLTAQDHPEYRVRCPIHGFIRFSRNERRIIDHAVFQRLRLIRQLALTEYVYPGATHTRFEHCLGVMEVATVAFDHLARRNGELLEKTFRTVSGFEIRPLAIARQLLRLAALLHDVGHASFSHAAEAVIRHGFGHEYLGLELIKGDAWLAPVLNSVFWQGCTDQIAAILKGPPDLPPQLQVLKNLVSGVTDADRIDYLLRDSYHCGVEYGHFEFRRLLESLELEEGPMQTLELALHRDGIHAFEGLILARYQMSTQVYYHRLRRLYDLYITRYHEALGADAFDTAAKVMAENDVTIFARIIRDADEGSDAGRWAKRIRDRKHHRVIHETGVDVDAFGVKRVGQVFTDLQEHFAGVEFLIDALKPVTIHSLLRPGDPSDAVGDELTLVDDSGGRRPVTEESQILREIPRKFQAARIFADVDAADQAARRAMADFARQRWLARGGH